MTNRAITRNTRQKRAIRRAFEQADRPLSADQVLAAAARESRGLGVATVYRTIKSLLEEGQLALIDVPNRGTFYELSGKEHHHHFACEGCGKVFELEGCTSELRGSLPRGFRARAHDVTVFGRCADCALPVGRPARAAK